MMKTPRYEPPPEGSPPRDHLIAAVTAAIRALEAAELLADELGDKPLSGDAADMSERLTEHAIRLTKK